MLGSRAGTVPAGRMGRSIPGRARGLLSHRRNVQPALCHWIVRSHAQATAPQPAVPAAEVAPEASRVATSSVAMPTALLQQAEVSQQQEQRQCEGNSQQNTRQDTQQVLQQQKGEQQPQWLPWMHVAAPQASTATASLLGVASAAFFFAPLFGKGRKGAPPETPVDAAEDPTVASPPATVNAEPPAAGEVAARSQAAPQLALGWWHALPRVYCISFGGRHGLMPRLALDARRPSALTLVAFEDAADAHYAAGVVREARTGGPDALPPPQVVSSSPLQVEDFARLQGTGVDVLPRGRINHGARLGMEALTVLLQEALGYSAAPLRPGRGTQQGPVPSTTAQQTQPLPSAAVAAAAAAAAAEAPPFPSVTQPSKVASVPPTRGTFSPVATDLPDLLRRSLGTLPDGMASAAAAVADAGATPGGGAAAWPMAASAPLGSSSEAAEASQEGGVVAEAPALAAEKQEAAVQHEAAMQQKQPATTETQQQWQQQDVQQQQEQQRSEKRRPAAANVSAPADVPAPVSPGVEAEGGAKSAPAIPRPRTFADAVRLVSPTFGRSAQEIQDLKHDLLAEFYQLESQWRGTEEEEEEEEEEEDKDQQQQQQTPQQQQQQQQQGDAVLGREVSRLEQRLDTLEQQRWEALTTPSSSGGGRGGGLPGAAEGLVAAHSELCELQGRVGDQLAALTSVESLEAAGVLAPDGTIDRRAGLGFMAQLQDTLDGLKRLQQRMEAVAEAAGMQLPPPPPRMADAVRERLGVTPQEEARMAEEIHQARTGQVAGGFSWRSSSDRLGGWRAAVDVLAEEVSAPPAQQPNNAAAAASSSAATGRPGNPTGQANSGNSTSGGSGPNSNSSGPRAWGSWASNERIARSGATLLPKGSWRGGSGGSSSSSSSSSSPTTPSQQTSSTSKQPSGPQPQSSTGDGATIVSKRIGSSREPRTPTDPRRRQDNVREALRAVAAEFEGGNSPVPSGPQIPAPAADPEAIPLELLGGDTSSGRPQWWARRYEALYLPTLGYPDGSVGFVQVDVSPRPGVKDVRVLSFADRHDCMHCLTVMREWPETAGCLLTMGAMRTATLEADLRKAWLEQRAQAAASRWAADSQPAGPQAPGPSPPSGVVVFRRGKLPMRPGMRQEEFMQGVMYQAVAQRALGGIGYDFED